MKTVSPGIYRHYKNILIRVLCVATHSETNEELVVYIHLDDGRMWARPLDMFMENVLVEGKEVPRFAFVSH